ncbi:MAG TPA: glutathione S-transferase C-terminal domain-containing protein, partial [Steroidobacteraceae bacterium]
VDEVMDAVEDITTRIGNTIRLEGEAKKNARVALAAGPIPRFLQQLDARLAAGGGEWFVENRLTVADLKCYILVRWLKSGVIDDVPADIVDKYSPLLGKHLERVKGHPKIAGYYAARGR